MKLTTILLLITLGVNAQIKSPYDDGLFISIGIDPKNALVGGTVNNQAIDLLLKTYYRADEVEVGIFYEAFPEISFVNYGILVNLVLDLQKVTHTIPLELVAGYEIGRIHNKTKKGTSTACNVELRYDIRRLVIGLQYQNKFRGELGRRVQSGYINLGYRLIRD